MQDEVDGKARNRENQRRSRQRQREYIASLEAKLAEYEQQGAQASHTMQAAARHVAEENVKLRDLLHGLCASKEEIEAFLAGSLDLQSLIISKFSPSPSNAGKQGGSCRTACSDKATAGLAALRASHARFEHDGPEKVANSTSTSKDVRPEVEHAQKDETDCEEAAKIIAGMRGDGDPDDLKSDLCDLLGCDTSKKCSVKNSRLFELIDR